MSLKKHMDRGYVAKRTDDVNDEASDDQVITKIVMKRVGSSSAAALVAASSSGVPVGSTAEKMEILAGIRIENPGESLKKQGQPKKPLTVSLAQQLHEICSEEGVDPDQFAMLPKKAHAAMAV